MRSRPLSVSCSPGCGARPPGPPRIITGVRAPTRSIGIGAVFLLLAGTLAIGHAIKAPCVHGDWSDGRPFTWLCHTDIIPLFGNEQLYGDRLPYLDPCEETEGTCDEYPVLTTWMMRFAASVAGPYNTRFFYANAIILWLAALLDRVPPLYRGRASSAVLRARSHPRDLRHAEPRSAPRRARHRRNGCLPPSTRRHLRGPARSRRRGEALPGAPRDPVRGRSVPGPRTRPGDPPRLGRRGHLDRGQSPLRARRYERLVGVLQLQRLETGRLGQPVVPRVRAGQRVGCTNTRLVNLGSLGLFIGWVAIVWTIKARRQPGFPRWTLGFPLIVLFLLTNKVYSPQYSVWLLPWFALALPHLRLFLAFEAADMAVFVTRFSWFGLLDGHHNGFAGSPLGAFEVAIFVRAVVLIICVIAWVRSREAAPSLEPRHPQTESVLGSRSPRDDPSRARRRRHGSSRRGARADRPSPAVLSRRVRRPPRRDVPDRRGRVTLFPPLRAVGVPGWPAPSFEQGWHNAFAAWERFDALWFLRIAEGGYRLRDGSAAFFPLVPAGDPRGLVRARRSPLRGGDDRVERRLLGRPGRHLSPDHLRAVRTHRPHHRAADVRVPDRALLPDALQRVAVPAPVRHGVLGSPPAAMVGRGRRRGAGGAHPQHRGRDRAGAA